jgi:hypothetical protein
VLPSIIAVAVAMPFFVLRSSKRVDSSPESAAGSDCISPTSGQTVEYESCGEIMASGDALQNVSNRIHGSGERFPNFVGVLVRIVDIS